VTSHNNIPKKSIKNEKVTLECPNCHWVFEATMVDKHHSFASVKEPQKDKITGDVTVENRVCRNPKCQKPFTLYWFDLKMHIDRM
jgi:hypothetical protein